MSPSPVFPAAGSPDPRLLEPRPDELEQLESIWQDQAAVQGPEVDMASQAWPGSWAQAAATIQEVEEALAGALGWPQWVRVYAKPSAATVAARRLAKERTGSGGVVYLAPGAGAPLDPPSGEPGLAVLRGDWAPDAMAVRAAQAEAREQGLMLMADEQASAFRLAPGGAVEAFGLEPDLALFGAALAGGLDFAALAGVGPAPDRPKAGPEGKALATAAGVIARAAQPGTAEMLAQQGRTLLVGMGFYRRRVVLEDQVRWEGPLAMPRLAGRRLWAFMELAREEGLALAPLVMPDPALSPEDAPDHIWPRVARAFARLRVLPEGEKAPLGWRDAAQATACRAARFFGGE